MEEDVEVVIGSVTFAQPPLLISPTERLYSTQTNLDDIRRALIGQETWKLPLGPFPIFIQQSLIRTSPWLSSVELRMEPYISSYISTTFYRTDQKETI
jgi:hypothetical protein